MAVNIGPKIGIEGEREYRKSINDLITQQKTFSAEMRELESSFDDSTSAMERNRKKAALLNKQIANQEKQVEELEKGLEAAEKAYGENANETQKWKQAVANAKTELNKMKKELGNIPSSMQQLGTSMQNVGKKMQSVGSTLTKSITAPLAALGAASVAAWKDVDDGMDIIVKKTGATGGALEALQETAKSIATTIPTSFETAGEAVGAVATRFNVTGEELEDLSTKFIKFADLNNTDVVSSVDNVQKVMEAYGVSTEDAGKLLDAMNKTGQDTGISMDSLESSMTKNAAALKSMGMDAYSAAGFLGQVETSGVGTETVMSGLSKALTNAGKNGQTLPDALSAFQEIMNSTATDQEKLTAACDLFGKKAGPAIYDACKQGSLSFEFLATDASEYLGNVDTTFENTLDPIDNFKVALNKAKDAGSEVGGTLLKIAAPAVSELGDMAKAAGDWFESLTEDQQNMVSYAAIFAAGLGPAVTVLGKLTEGAGLAIEAIGKIEGASSAIGGLISPAGLAIAGLIAMSAAMAESRKKGLESNEALQEILGTLTGATEELGTATEELNGTVKAAQDNLDDINAKATNADKLVTELFKLEKQSNKTAIEQGRMKMIVDQLNEMYPELGLSIDTATGKLNQGEEAVRGYVNSAKDMALIEAYGTAAAETLSALVKESIAYEKALAAQSAGTKQIAEFQEAYNTAIANAPTSWNGQGVWDEQSKTMKVVTADVTNASNALKAAEEQQVALNTAVDEASAAMDNAQQEYDLYTKAQSDLAAKMGETTSEQENETEATEKNTESVKANSAALAEKFAAAVKLGSQIASSISDMQAESKAWDDLYKATYDSISGQIGLFDEWSQETEITAKEMLEHLQSQTEGYANYASNMEKLSKLAKDSSDPNFKALVQSIADMGIDGAAYLQELVNAAETDSELFNSLIAEYGNTEAAKKNAAKITTDVKNEFTSKADIIAKGFNKTLTTIGNSKTFKTLKTNMKGAVEEAGKRTDDLQSRTHTALSAMTGDLTSSIKTGFSSLVSSASESTTLAVTDTQERINKMVLKPSVDEIDVPQTVTNDAKYTIETSLVGIGGTVGTITGGAAAGKAAHTEAQNNFGSLKGSVSSISGGAAAAKAAHKQAQDNFGTVSGKVALSGAAAAAKDAVRIIKNNIPTVYVPVAAKNASAHRRMANGGFIEHEQVILAGEQDKPEVIIPLSATKRSRALDLYQETGEILGVNTASSLRRSTSKTLPSQTSAAVNSTAQVNTVLDTEKLYSAVAAGAERGMENAKIRIVTNNRELGRTLRDMGVMFA